MAIFRPTAMKPGVASLTPEFLSGLGVRALLLDVNNTIAGFTSHQPIPGAVDWVQSMVEAGFRVIIVSNNFRRRVSAFAEKFGLDWISFAMKPLPFGYLKAKAKLRVKCSECAIIGDQIFTDVIGANLCGMRSVLLTPIELEDGFSFKVRRHFEKGLRKKYQAGKDVIV